MKISDFDNVFLIILTIFLFTVFLMIGVTDREQAEKVLEENGFTNVHMTGYSFFSCAGDDWYHTGFKATDEEGDVVTGTVCSGIIFKNSTIKFN